VKKEESPLPSDVKSCRLGHVHHTPYLFNDLAGYIKEVVLVTKYNAPNIS
jgi:hypothetical protein